jgi:hypothetical protein
MNIEAKGVIGELPLRRAGSLHRKASVVSACKEREASCPSRRQEVRVNEPRLCAYSLCEWLDGGHATIEQGEAYCLNRSEHGILVLMGNRPRKRQLLELHVAETRREYSLNLFEVRWTKSIPIESQGELFLVGCRLVFEAP